MKFKSALYKNRESPPGKVHALMVNSNGFVKRMIGQKRPNSEAEEKYETVGGGKGGDLIKV